ncbi:RNA-directed DNA polymerase, eukaryota [Tanacetum coccineum]
MRDGNWKSYKSKEDQTQSIFVTNFVEHVTARDLWKVCNGYGVVVDAFILYKKSKAGSVYWVRAKEMEAWDPFICNDSYESDSYDDEEDACMHNNDLLYDNNHNNIKPDKDKVLFEDPFNLYDILNKKKDSGDDLKYPPGLPSVINLEEVNKKKKDAPSHKTTKRYIPVEKKSDAKKPGRQIPTGQRFYPTKSSTVWIPTRKILETYTNDSALSLGKKTCTPNTVICANSYLSICTSMDSEPISSNGSTNVLRFDGKLLKLLLFTLQVDINNSPIFVRYPNLYRNQDIGTDVEYQNASLASPDMLALDKPHF